MSINAPREVNLVKSFERRRAITYFLWLASAVCIAVAVFSLRNPGTSFTGLEPGIERWVFLAGAVILFGISIYVWRCPACHKFLGITVSINACKKCNTVFLGGNKKN